MSLTFNDENKYSSKILCLVYITLSNKEDVISTKIILLVWACFHLKNDNIIFYFN